MWSFIHVIQSGGSSPANWPITVGNVSSDEAKITGITPAMLIFNGMYVDEPPSVRRPTTRFAYCTGMRRWLCSTNTTTAMTANSSNNSRNVLMGPFDEWNTAKMFAGNAAAIEVKISSDMPLPTPRSVMRSPSHMTKTVPAVMVSTMSEMVCHDSSGMMVLVQPGKNWPLRASVTYDADCSAAKPTVM